MGKLQLRNYSGNTWILTYLGIHTGVCVAASFVAIYKAKMSTSVTSVVLRFYEDYMKTTPSKLKLIDAYLLYIFLTGVIQFVYCCLVGTFPFNSFLSGFISTVGSFVLAGTYFKNSK